LQPVDILRRVRHAQFLELYTRSLQLLLCLQKIAGIGPQASEGGGHYQGAGRAGKARQPLSCLPVLRQVLALVRVSTQYEAGCKALLLHLVA